MRRSLACLLAVLVLTAMAGCEGKRGPAGPAGPTGPQGPAGVAPIFWEDFEQASIPSPPWTFTYDAAWTRVNQSMYGSYSAKSGAIDDDEASGISITVNFPKAGLVSFFAAVSSESGYDWLMWGVDNHLVDGISGAASVDPYFLAYSFPVAPGEHTIDWVYAKDSSGVDGLDGGWLDGVMILNYEASAKTVPSKLPEGIVLWSEYQKSTPAVKRR